MDKLIKILHYTSLIKYPILLIGIYFFYKPLLIENSNLYEDYNHGLIFFGLGIGLDSLKDYQKLTWLDKKVYYKPKIAKYYFLVLGFSIFSIIAVGILYYFRAEQSVFKELSIGFIIVGIGSLGLLKSGIQTTKEYIERTVS